MKSINPYTGKTIAEYDEYPSSKVDKIIIELQDGFDNWKSISLNKRCLYNIKMANLLESKKTFLAELITHEMGKPNSEALAEIEKCIWLCKYYSNPEVLGIDPVAIKTEAKYSGITFEPIGIIFAIMPWNFPFWQVFRFAIPCISAGNVVLLKHAPNVCGCSLAIEALFLEVFSEIRTFKSILIEAERSEEIIQQPYIKGVTITGSEKAGKSVASIAGKYLKKVVLELGGSDPFIVFEDANIEKCCKAAVRSRMLNAGQVCIAAKRFIVHESVFEKFIDAISLSINKLNIGDPMLPETEIGPMARPDLLDGIEKQVNDSIAKGAKVIIGGKRDTLHNGFYLPTLLTNITEDMPVFCEETFGPVAVLIPFKTDEEAIRLANNTRFGLGASIWTNDLVKAEIISKSIDSGCVFINSMVKSDPRLPFGGSKNSGMGRELTSLGVQEFMNIKTWWID